MVEFYAANANDPADYLIGEEFDLANHAGFRRMDNPIRTAPRRTAGARTPSNLDVHYSSGVANHFYYLLAEGSGAEDDQRHRAQLPDLQRLDGHRHRPGRRAADLVPGADGLHDLGHDVRAGPHRHAERRDATSTAPASTQHNTVAAAWSAVSVN